MKSLTAYVKQSLQVIYGTATLIGERPVSAVLEVNDVPINSPVRIYYYSGLWTVQFQGAFGVYMAVGDTAEMNIAGANGGHLTLTGVAVASGTNGAAIARLK